jgi:hypothetical protein
MNNELENHWMETVGLLSWHFPGGTEENHDGSSVRIAGVPTEFRTAYFLNTRPEPYRYANSVGVTGYRSDNASGCFWACFTKFCVHLYARSGGSLDGGIGCFYRLI